MTFRPSRRAPWWGLAAALLVLAWALPARAQSLAEVTLVAATATELHPSVQLPRGSVRALGPGREAWIRKVPDAHAWRDWEAYVAQGLATHLRDGYVHQVATSFAAAGFFEAHRETRRVGGETHTRIEFENTGGARTLLYLIEGPDALLWLVAASR